MRSIRARIRPNRTHKRREEASSPFHKTLLSSKTCGLSRYTDLDIRITRCLLHSVVKDRPFRSSVSDRNVSAPGGAQTRIGAESAKKRTENKKPGDERRANPSISQGASSARLLGGCARSSISFYPVFVTNLTSG